VQPWEETQRTSPSHLATRSLPLHPCRLFDATPPTSAQVASRLPAAVEAMAALARRQQLPARLHAMQKVHQQGPALAALVDFWWPGVGQDGEPCALSPRWRQGVQEGLLPLVSWDHQGAHMRCARSKPQFVQALEAVRTAFDTHTMTRRLDRQVLEEWRAWARRRGQVFARASSAVEGRNGSLSHMHQNQRGLPKPRSKVWTILHHVDCRASDGTTPAARCFRWPFPDLFETVLSQVETLPQPRRRQCQVALSPGSHTVSRLKRIPRGRHGGLPLVLFTRTFRSSSQVRLWYAPETNGYISWLSEYFCVPGLRQWSIMAH